MDLTFIRTLKNNKRIEITEDCQHFRGLQSLPHLLKSQQNNANPEYEGAEAKNVFYFYLKEWHPIVSLTFHSLSSLNPGYS